LDPPKRQERFEMADTSEAEGRGSGIVRKLAVPVAISLVGSLLGFVLSRRDRLRAAGPKLRETISDLPLPEGGVGEITSDLQGKLDEVLGKEPSIDGDLEQGVPTDQDLSEFEERRRARQERRDRRRRRSRS
jgi:hypothetical protein